MSTLKSSSSSLSSAASNSLSPAACGMLRSREFELLELWPELEYVVSVSKESSSTARAKLLKSTLVDDEDIDVDMDSYADAASEELYDWSSS
jgi:hypothetical protein